MCPHTNYICVRILLICVCSHYDTCVRMLLGRWIEMARAWGQTPAEKDLMEFNARNLVTLWGPRGEIADYASKQWSGLIADYYR